MARDDPTPIRPADDRPQTAAPPASLGDKLYDVARPLVGDHRADHLAAITGALDAAPELWSILSSLRPDPADTMSASIPVAAPMTTPNPTAPPKLSRWPMVALGSICFALVIGWFLTVGFGLWAIRSTETRVASNEGEARAVRAQGEQRAQETKADLAKLTKKSTAHDMQIALLAQMMLGRLEALGKKTGADQLEEWGEVPDDLELLAVQARITQRAGG